ncbi:MAG: helix-turn-helix domain-containing protein [Bacilli bacterium]|jgi:transcriptional regulator with XRE-family HTH domain
MKFCDKLPKLRKDNNLSQEQLADCLGVSRQAVSKWESGSSYPDMEKIIQLCKVLNCSLDELIDDDATGNKDVLKNSKININDWLKDLLNFITKTYNMFCNMKFFEKIKCLIEMFLIILFLFIAFWLFGVLISSIVSKILYLLPGGLYRLIINTGEILYSVIGIVLGFIITLHLFKTRYLNYFVTIEDYNIGEQVIEEPIDENKIKDKAKKMFLKKPKEKIIIRDPKHTTFSFFTSLGKVLLFFIKIFAIMLAIPAILSFVGISFAETVSIWLIKNGTIFFGTTITLLGFLALNYLIIEDIYNLILNKRPNFKKIFITFIASLISIGLGFGISFCSYLTFTPMENNNEFSATSTLDIPMKNNLVLSFPIENITIDDNLEDIKIVVRHLDYTAVDGYYYENDGYYVYDIYSTYSPNNFISITNMLIKDFKNKKARNYDTVDYEIEKILMSEKNLNKIKDNNYIFQERE